MLHGGCPDGGENHDTLDRTGYELEFDESFTEPHADRMGFGSLPMRSSSAAIHPEPSG